MVDHVATPFHLKWCRVWRLGKPSYMSKHKLKRPEWRCDDMANPLTMSPQSRAIRGATWDHTYTSHRNTSHLQINSRKLATKWSSPWPCRRTSLFGPKRWNFEPNNIGDYKYEHTRQNSGGFSTIREKHTLEIGEKVERKERIPQIVHYKIHRERLGFFRQEVKIKGGGSRSNPPEFTHEDH